MENSVYHFIRVMALIAASCFLFSCSDSDTPEPVSRSWSYTILHPEGKCWYSQARSLSNGKAAGAVYYVPKTGDGYLVHGAVWTSLSSESFTDLGGGYQESMSSEFFAISEKGAGGETVGYPAYSQDFKYPLTLVKSLDFVKYSTIMSMSANWMASNAETEANEFRSLLWRIAGDDQVEMFNITPDEGQAVGMAMYVASADNPGVVVGSGPLSHHSDAILWNNFSLNGSEITYDYVNLHPSDDYWASESWAVYGNQQGGFVQGYPGPDDPDPSDMRNRAALWSGTPESFKNLHPSIEGVKNSRIRGMAGGVQVGEVFYGDDILTDPPCHAFVWFGSADDYVDLHTLLPDYYSSSYAIGVEKVGDDIHVVGFAINDNADVGGREEAVSWTYSTSKPAVLSGKAWVQATASAQFPARQEFTTLVFDNKLWVIGGSDGYTIYGDVWYSTDGTTWIQATGNASFGKRFAHSSAVFDDKMWVIGGITTPIIYNVMMDDVWSSVDGVSWTREAEGVFEGRDAMALVSGDGKMWMLGGWMNPHDRVNQVWHSTDGATWTQVATTSDFTGRCELGGAYYQGKLWVMAGQTSATHRANDVWYAE